MNYDKTNKRIRRVAILANGGDVAGLNPVIIGFFSVIFLFYTNSFIMKRRKKELGIYNIPEWRKGACSEEYTYTPTIPASHPKKTASYGKQKKKKAEPHFDQQSVYQEPGYHDFPDDFSADNYSDHTDMVPLDKDSIMS